MISKRIFSAVVTFALLTIAAQGQSLPVQTISFSLINEGRSQKIEALILPDKIRVNQPDEKFALIYESEPKRYTGLELRDAHYWQFHWRDLESTIRETKRYEERFRDLNLEGLASYDLERAANPEATSSAPLYRWRPGGRERKIGDYSCQLWLGESDQAPPVEAWCVEKIIPGFHESLARLKEINEPMALVAIHPLLPPLYFAIADSLKKAGVTPVELRWTKSSAPTTVTLKASTNSKSRESDWKIPDGYLKSELGALEGIVTSQKK